MSNFAFLKSEWSDLHGETSNAEARAKLSALFAIL